jgi:hypothetical protein
MRPLPDYLADLPDEIAVRHLTTEFLEGREDLPPAELDSSVKPFGKDLRWSTAPLRELVDEAMKRFNEHPVAADAWLAPRLHATLRITRAEASVSGLWNHLALRVAPDYVAWRHPGRISGEGAGRINRDRFNGPFHKQAFTRLWWAAELFRDGYDYAPVEFACRNQDVINTVLAIEIIRHRPVAQAYLRLLADGTVRTGDHANQLSTALNAAGMTLVYEALAPDAPPDPDAYRAWIEQRLEQNVPLDSLPEGPDDGRAPIPAINALVPLFRRLFEERPAAWTS